MSLRQTFLYGFFSILSLQVLAGCAKLPDNSIRESSHVISDGESTSLGQAFKPQIEQHPGQSGVLLLGNGLDAFVGRAVLASLAERSIDVQYYMFHQDTVGRLLIKEFVAAADRGVRVRLLIDDMYGEEADDVWSALATHPNMEVRLYNPFVRGHSKNLQFITQTKRVNHRMHSKTYTVDNQASIVGGRNIGDEYFNADKNVAFSDLDAMIIGPVVPEVSSEFDQYWNNRHSYPVATLVAGVAKEAVAVNALGQVRKELDAFYQQPQTLAYRNAVEHSPFAIALKNKTAAFSFSEAKIIHDSAEKMTKQDDNWKEELLMSQLAPYILQAKKEYILVSPYFVPGQRGADAICKLSNQGVRVRILTNSLASNDVAAVHTGYMRHRKQLLRCGVELYELNEQLKKLEGKRFTWLPGLSKSSLHAKTMAMDKNVMFVGSFNFDQRSLNINTEIGIVFEDPEIAALSSEHFDKFVDKVAFRVELIDDSLRWTGIGEDGKKVVFDTEPYTSFWKRLSVNLMRVLPIDSML
ncbi:MAG: phospholipase D family protein [Gammaproteobacteria bacterium]|nr:MAG: phospholipase D family protein [Gammaproteobacteria bacterium]